MGWLDYSLLVFKVNWAQYGIDNNISEQEYLRTLFINSLYLDYWSVRLAEGWDQVIDKFKSVMSKREGEFMREIC